MPIFVEEFGFYLLVNFAFLFLDLFLSFRNLNRYSSLHFDILRTGEHQTPAMASFLMKLVT